MGEHVEVWYRSEHHIFTLSRQTTTHETSRPFPQKRSSSDSSIKQYFTTKRTLMLFGATGRFIKKR